MSREYDLYMQLQDMQPQMHLPHNHYPAPHLIPHSGRLPIGYEVTAAGQAGCPEPSSSMPHHEAHRGLMAQRVHGSHRTQSSHRAHESHRNYESLRNHDMHRNHESLHHHESRRDHEMQRKRKNHHFSSISEFGDDSDIHIAGPSPRKSKSSCGAGSSAYDDDGEDSRSTRTVPDKKQNHSEIEKRRRDKMNTYITELGAMVPMCRALARKLDKLTVLRMAVQHIRSVRGTLNAGPLTNRPRPTVLSEQELNALVVKAASHCFILVVGCDRGRLLYVSKSVEKMLNYHQSELLGQSLFDLLHPKDVAKVKEQLSSSDLSPRERLIDAKTMLPLCSDVVTGMPRLGPGARRSFCCRVKSQVRLQRVAPGAGAELPRQKPERKYCVVQCTGYLKSWAPAEMSDSGSGDADPGEDGDSCSISCLVAVVRAWPDWMPPEDTHTAAIATPPPTQSRPLQYISRHAPDGKFLFVDQRVTLALGLLPHELVGTSLYEHVRTGHAPALADAHRATLLSRTPVESPPYAFRRRDGTYVTLLTHFKHFINPWTKELECLVANNTLLSDQPPTDEMMEQYSAFKNSMPGPSSDSPTTMLNHMSDDVTAEVQRLIGSRAESHKIGSAIAEEAMRRSSPPFSPDLSIDLLHDAVFNQQPNIVDSILSGDSPYSQVRNNVCLGAAAGEASPPPTDPPATPTPPSPPSDPSPLTPAPCDGNGEAAMAVIMNLLEADAGLGGPVNMSGLPWLLP